MQKVHFEVDASLCEFVAQLNELESHKVAGCVLEFAKRDVIVKTANFPERMAYNVIGSATEAFGLVDTFIGDQDIDPLDASGAGDEGESDDVK